MKRTSLRKQIEVKLSSENELKIVGLFFHLKKELLGLLARIAEDAVRLLNSF